MDNIKKYLPGVLFTLGIATVAYFLGVKFPIIGGAVFGIVLGMLIKAIWQGHDSLTLGVHFSSKKILQWSIIALGASLSLTRVYHVGISSFSVMSFTLLTAFGVAYGMGKILKLPFKLTTLIGMGTAICGGSAIAAISPVIEAEDEEIAYAISTIFLFNVIAVLTFPLIGHFMHMTPLQFGLFAGTAINDTSSVVAAGYTYSQTAGDYATIVKLTRTTMIIPITLIYALVILYNKKRSATADNGVNYNFKKIFPWFIIGFIGMSLLNTLGIITPNMARLFSKIGKFFIIVAMSAIGFKTNFRQIVKAGYKPLLLGMIVWLSVSVCSLILI